MGEKKQTTILNEGFTPPKLPIYGNKGSKKGFSPPKTKPPISRPNPNNSRNDENEK